jgi:hypothetical protein
MKKNIWGAIYGRVFRTVEDVCETVKKFVDLYNREWRVEIKTFKAAIEIHHDWQENSQAA